MREEKLSIEDHGGSSSLKKEWVACLGKEELENEDFEASPIHTKSHLEQHTTENTFSPAENLSFLSSFGGASSIFGAWRSCFLEKTTIGGQALQEGDHHLSLLLNSIFYLLVFAMVCIYWIFCMVYMCNMS